MFSLDEDPRVYSGHYEVELTVERPLSEVWIQFLNIPSWVTSHHIEHVYGTPGTIGSITRVSFKKAVDLGMSPPHFHFCKLIEVVHEKHWLLKTYSGKEGSCGMQNICAFDHGRVFVINPSRTKVTFNLYVELRVEGTVENREKINLDVSRIGMLNNLQNLKRILEQVDPRQGH